MGLWDYFLGRSASDVALTEPGAQAEARCSFCRRAREDVAKIVIGPEASICDACVLLSAVVIEEVSFTATPEERLATASSVVFRELDLAGARAPRAITRPLARAAIELCRGGGERLRRLAGLATTAADDEVALEALRAITASERTAADALGEAISLSSLGEHQDALERMEAVSSDALDPATRAALPIHRLMIRLEASVATADEIAGADAMVARALAALAAIEPHVSPTLIRAGAYARARAAAHRGEHSRAEALVREHLASEQPGPELYVLLADLLARRGAIDEASAAREQALALAHPEGRLAAELAARAPRAPFR
jgi:hypothetical protein